MWTLILTLTIIGNSTHTAVIPNLPSREICRQTGENHIEQYNRFFNKWHKGHVGIYTCVEQKQ